MLLYRKLILRNWRWQDKKQRQIDLYTSIGKKLTEEERNYQKLNKIYMEI